MTDKEILIKKLKEIINKPGGNIAIKFILDSFGTFLGGINLITDNIDKSIELLDDTNVDYAKILIILESELNNQTKANFSLLIGEILGLKIPFMIQTGTILKAYAILNPESVIEFRGYQDLGWITIIQDDNVTRNTPIEDKKRPWGIMKKFMITINESYYS